MAGFDYDEAAADALELLTEFGGSVELERKQRGEYDNSTGEVPSYSEFFPAVGVVLPFKEGKTMHHGTVIQATDQWLLLAASGLDVTPIPTDKVTIGCEVFEIASVKTLRPNPGAVAVLHDCMVRK